MIGILDFDIGNIQSVMNALHFVGGEGTVIDRPEQIDAYPKLILPGVGAFGAAIDTIRERGFEAPLRRAILDEGRPLLAICLGMQLLLDSSEEDGFREGLGIVPGKVLPFRKAIPEDLAVPHVGWNTLLGEAADPVIGEGVIGEDGADRDFYFVHSHYCSVEDPDAILYRCSHGIEFDAAFARGNLFACQFHPEKSLQAGLRIFRRFVEL